MSSHCPVYLTPLCSILKFLCPIVIWQCPIVLKVWSVVSKVYCDRLSVIFQYPPLLSQFPVLSSQCITGTMQSLSVRKQYPLSHHSPLLYTVFYCNLNKTYCHTATPWCVNAMSYCVISIQLQYHGDTLWYFCVSMCWMSSLNWHCMFYSDKWVLYCDITIM